MSTDKKIMATHTTGPAPNIAPLYHDDATANYRSLEHLIDFSDGIFSKSPELRKRAKLVSYADIKLEKLEWLWKDRVPLGKLTLFCGPPGVGKSTVSDYLASLVTNGSLSKIPGDVLFLSEEDGLGDTKVPRLKVMGANLNLITGLSMTIAPDANGTDSERSFALNLDLDLLREWLSSHPHAKLVTIDPVTNYLSGVRSNNESDVRTVLMPLAKLAEEFDISIVMISHFNKTYDAEAIARASGAAAFVGVPRCVWNFTKNAEADNEGECLMSSPKNPHLKSQRYRIVETTCDLPGGRTTKVGTVEFLGESDQTADSVLLKLNDPERGKLNNALEWLRENLRERTEAGQVLKECTRACRCSEDTVKRAQKKLGGVDIVNEKGRWYWIPREGDSA
jgi:putative DNA primase/helicase